MDSLINILSDISNFALVIFGFCATLYTVIYSFILNKKESLNEITELIKLSEKVPLQTLKETSFKNYIIRMRRFNSYIIYCLWSSLIIYIASLIIKYFEFYKLILKINDTYSINGYLVYMLLLLTIVLFISITILINRSIVTYNKTTKI